MCIKCLCGSLFATLIMVSLYSVAATPPPEMPFSAITWKFTAKEKPTTGVRMGSLRVMFEKTTLNDVREAASVGEISHQGDAALSVYWLCYTNLSAMPAERIWVIADGEMGGREHSVTGVSAQLIPNGNTTEDCPALPAKLKPLSLNHDLWLNSLDNDVVKNLGTPSYSEGVWRSYDYQGKVPGKCEGGFDVLNGLLLRIQNGRVIELNANQVTSC